MERTVKCETGKIKTDQGRQRTADKEDENNK
jgi:hypothetical protein